MILIAAFDYTFGGDVLVGRTEWTVVQVVFWAAASYLVGQLIAAPSSALLEHGLTRWLLRPPTAILLGLQPRRWIERALAALFAEREYAPLPVPVREKILSKAAAKLGVEPSALTDPEAIFLAAYPASRTVADAVTRMDQFRNLYGFSRNVAFVSSASAVLLACRYFLSPSPQTAWLLAAAIVFAIGMYGRFATMQAMVPMSRLGMAEECVGAFLYLASEQMSGYVTGQIIEVNGGQYMA
jgi:hypothetical protein